MGKMNASADDNERKVIKTLKKRHGPAYRAWFVENLVNKDWGVIERNGFRLLKSPSDRIIDPFQGYRRPISYAILRMGKPGFYFILNWGKVPTQGQIDRLRKVIRRFSRREKEIALFRLKRLGVWFVLIGGKNNASFTVRRNNIDKKYFEGIYEADEESDYFVEVDIDIHSHPDDLDVSSGDRNYAKSAVIEKRFFTVTYKDGFAPFTWRGRKRDFRGKKIVILWDRIRPKLFGSLTSHRRRK